MDTRYPHLPTPSPSVRPAAPVLLIVSTAFALGLLVGALIGRVL